jgi:hypothetical protein
MINRSKSVEATDDFARNYDARKQIREQLGRDPV